MEKIILCEVIGGQCTGQVDADGKANPEMVGLCRNCTPALRKVLALALEKKYYGEARQSKNEDNLVLVFTEGSVRVIRGEILSYTTK